MQIDDVLGAIEHLAIDFPAGSASLEGFSFGSRSTAAAANVDLNGGPLFVCCFLYSSNLLELFFPVLCKHGLFVKFF